MIPAQANDSFGYSGNLNGAVSSNVVNLNFPTTLLFSSLPILTVPCSGQTVVYFGPWNRSPLYRAGYTDFCDLLLHVEGRKRST